ncbi:DUF4291 family protein [Streptomyces sp. NPDC050743]|uniref:DUF4291 family protein n=1 Tax=Streptomyces sp. NPDC050743 TaxID=3365634 RepID=UPI0037B0F902
MEIDHAEFEWALRHPCLRRYVPAPHEDRASWKRRLRRAPARGQWDPERDPRHSPLPYRSLRLGLAGEAAARYADEWIGGIEDVTAPATEVHDLVRAREPERATRALREERP